MKKLVTIALTLAGLLPFVSSGQADEMRNASSLQLRQGPGTHYAKTVTIAPKQNVKIGVCNPSWCHVSVGKKAGWVPTAQINPALARMKGTNGRSQLSANSYPSGGGGGSAGASNGARMHSSTTMTITMRIVSEEEMQGQKGRASVLPFPVPAHRQARTR